MERCCTEGSGVQFWVPPEVPARSLSPTLPLPPLGLSFPKKRLGKRLLELEFA
jgi:hypothetical protein